MAHLRWALRRELLVEADPAGGVRILDPLFERVVVLDAAQVAALDAGDPAALATLDDRWLRESPAAEAVRRAAWSARLRPEPARPAVRGDETGDACVDVSCVDVSGIDWAPAWRDAERWRRLFAAAHAGNTLLPLDGLLPPALAEAAAAQAQTLPCARVEAAVVSAERALVDEAIGGPLGEVRARLTHPATRRFFGAALGRDLGGPMHLNVWHLAPEERMAVHQDGARYAATVAVGLNAGWTAADGGAIAYGVPGPGGLGVSHRWLPHLGDVVVFAPTATSWHAVEPPARDRWTLSGWWLR